MKEYGNTGVFYSSEYFTKDMIDWLLQSPSQKDLVAKEEGLPTQIEAAEVSVESAFEAAWAEMSKDQEFVRAVQQRNYTADQGLADFRSAIVAPISSALDKQLSSALTVDYVTKIQDGNFVHYLDGEKILAIPQSAEAAALVSDYAEATMYGIFVVIDVLSVLAAAAGITVCVNKSEVTKGLQGVLKKFLQQLKNPKYVIILKQLQEKGDKIALIQKVVLWLRGSTDLKAVIKKFFESMSLLDRAVAVVQLLASILLLLGTAGASFAVKVLQLAAAIAFLLTDVAKFVLALQ